MYISRVTELVSAICRRPLSSAHLANEHNYTMWLMGSMSDNCFSTWVRLRTQI